jgi:hypothetical protein
MRTLASIKRIGKIHPIEGKDRIVLAEVDGWTVIVQKSEYSEGDLCVYVEIDSVLPEKPEFEFLRSKDFRIKTMKMAGCISQGICFPLSILPEGNYNEGDDVTETLGVTKWERKDATDVNEEAVAKAATKAKYPKWLMRHKWFRQLVYRRGDHRESKAFPDFISKTDETRIQNAPFYLDADEPWTVTEKIDGQSGTFALVRRRRLLRTHYEYIVCSRNLRLFKKDSSSYWTVSDRYEIEKHLREFLDLNPGVEWVAIQGECIGPKVQGNKYKVTEPDLFVFNLIVPTGRVPSVEASDVIINDWGMKFVPILAASEHLPKTVPEMLEMAHGNSALGHTIREGVVCRSMDGKRSFKAVDPLFLIKYNE